MKFTSRESNIIIIIQDSNYSLSQLATNFKVSTKTIKSDLARINQKISSYDSMITITNNQVGFKSIYPPVHWKNIVKLNRTIEEEDLIFLKLLFKTDYIPMSDFAAELYISKSKLEKLIQSVPNLNQYVVRRRNLGIAVELEIAQKLKLAISTLVPYVDDLNYLVTARALIQQVSEVDINFDDFNLYIKQFNYRINQLPNITDQECKILILLILISNHILNLTTEEVNQLVAEYINDEQSSIKLKAVIEAKVREVLSANNVTTNDQRFITSLTAHIDNVINNHYPNTIEPQMELRLKTEYSYAYSIATELYNRLSVLLSVDLPVYEKNYLALYIQSVINSNNQAQAMNLLIVCQYGMSVSHYIQAWIEQNLNIPLNFKISSVLNYWQIKDPANSYDVIITTIDNLELQSANLIKVETIPLEQQLLAVKQKIINVHFQKQINSFFSNKTLKQITISELDEVYPIINKDFKGGNPKFLTAMKKRTNEGLSNVNGVIIMHSDGTLITENRLLIYKLKQPLCYQQGEVKMIFVFAFTTEFIERFNSVIKQLYRIIYSEQYVHALYETKTDEQFMWIFRNQIKDKSIY